MEITDPGIMDYLWRLGPEVPEYVHAMEQEARRRDFPIVDRLVGRLLSVLTRLRRPELVVELGSGFGYSAWWFARAMDRGRVVLSDFSESNISSARSTFEDAGLLSRAEFHVGDAVDIARGFEQIDVLFVDHEKRRYLESVEELIPRLSPNGMVIADNTLWYGRVLSGGDASGGVDKDTQGVREFNDFMFSREDFDTTLVPLRDGVLVAVLKG